MAGISSILGFRFAGFGLSTVGLLRKWCLGGAELAWQPLPPFSRCRCKTGYTIRQTP
jgi:hypothetical protein